MMNLIETNQQLFGSGGLLFVVMTVLWLIQFIIIGYGKKTLIQLQQYWRSIKHKFELDKRLFQFKTK